MKNEIILFENQNVKLEVNMKEATVWLALSKSNIAHLRLQESISFKNGEGISFTKS